MSHEFKDDVDRFMDHIKKAINLRVEVDIPPFPLRTESDKMIRDAEYMVYELIDNAMEDGSIRSRDVDGNTVITSRPNEFGDIIEVTMKHQR